MLPLPLPHIPLSPPHMPLPPLLSEYSEYRTSSANIMDPSRDTHPPHPLGMPQVLQLSLHGPQSEQHSSHDPQFEQHSKQFPHELVQEPAQQPLPGVGVGVGSGSGVGVGSEPEVEPPLPHESRFVNTKLVLY